MRKYLYWLLPLAWMGVIFYSSSQPYEKQDIKPVLVNLIDLSFLEPLFAGISFMYNRSEVSINALGMEGFIEFFIRKGAHFTVFFILMGLFYIAFKKTSRLHTYWVLIVSFLLSLTYASIDEYHQGFTSNRTPYFGDIVIDVFGAFFAGLLLLLLFRKKT